MSEEKVLTLRGKKAVWAPGGGSGPIDPKRLPEGYPYKESVPSDTLTWDGNTEGLLCVANLFYKVSDAVPTMEDCSNGGVFNIAGESGALTFRETEEGIIGDNYNVVFIVPESVVGADINGMVFPESGVYYKLASHEAAIQTARTLTIPGYTGFTKTEIHPMAPEFLPAGVGGVSFIVFNDSNDIFCSVSFEKLLSMLCNFAAVNACVYKRSASDSSSADYLPAESIRFMPDGSGYIEIHVPDDSRYIKYSADGLSWYGGVS